MHVHRLTLEADPSHDGWLLEWDDTDFTLTSPDGETLLEVDTGYAHRLIGLDELYDENKISLTSPVGTLVFRKNRGALADLRKFLESGLASDVEYRTEVRRRSLRAIPRGLIILAAAGGPFGLYCWFASWVPDPPPGH